MLPWSPESETALLGSLLLDCQTAWDKAQPMVPENFFDSRHRAIFTAVGTLHARKAPVDVVTVFEQLRDQKQADDAGGMPYLSELSQAAYSAHRAATYAAKVREMAMRRALLETLDKGLELASEPGGTIVEKLDAITSALGQLQRQQVSKVPRTLSQGAHNTLRGSASWSSHCRVAHAHFTPKYAAQWRLTAWLPLLPGSPPGCWENILESGHRGQVWVAHLGALAGNDQ